MRNQISRIGIWTVLVTFLAFSICLPLGHICLDRIPSADNWTLTKTANHSTVAHDTGWWANKVQDDHRDEVCQACLLAQNLLLDNGSVDLTSIQTARSIFEPEYASFVPSPDSFLSHLNKAPPSVL
jgi:hypothetical protein